MSTLYGISSTSGSSDWMTSMLGGSSSSSSTSSSSGILDLKLIQSGSYKKLLKAYYKNEESSKTEAEEKADKVNLTSAKNDAKSLASASTALVKGSFEEEDREKIIENIKAFAKAYNDVVKDTDEVEDTNVLRNTLWMTKQTNTHAKSLKEIGITIGEGNELKVDEDKLKTANMSTMKSLFSGYSSYGSYIAGKSSQIYAASNAALTKTGSGSAYTSKGKLVNDLTGSLVDMDV